MKNQVPREKQTQDIADVLREVSDRFNGIRNGHCTICGQCRLYNTRGQVGPCENTDCLSHRIALVLDQPATSHGNAVRWVKNRLRPEHKCRPLARALMIEPRDWWIGELLEPVADWPNETHCLHMKTPLKDVSFLCNAGDFEQLLILSNAVVRLKNLVWLNAVTAAAKARLLPPFAPAIEAAANTEEGEGND